MDRPAPPAAERLEDPGLVHLVEEIRRRPRLSPPALDRLVRRHPGPRGLRPRKDIVRAFRALAPARGWQGEEAGFLEKLRLKPVRTLSGVAPVTVLTRPHPCPGRCLFCPSDVRMPKSYLAMEPGAQRATQNRFDPYLQTWNRLRALEHNGHRLDKVELIVLGGTWTSYPEDYQVWFVKRCFDALNDFPGRAQAPPDTVGLDFLDLEEAVDGLRPGPDYNQVVAGHLRRHRGDAWRPEQEEAVWEDLERAHAANETARARAVGLSLETRPDEIDPETILRLRRLGATKVQVGVQSLDDAVLAANRRGHDVACTRRAFTLLRAAGFKLHAHWMPNLHGATPAGDREDFRRLFEDPALRPDELKIYPLSLIASTPLMALHQAGEFRPYGHDELVDLLVDCMAVTPPTCRLTRVIRDIPSTDIVAGNRRNNLREIVAAEAARRGLVLRDIRARQIRRPPPPFDELRAHAIEYRTSVGTEVFLERATAADELVGFLRLSLPAPGATPDALPEIRGAAMIREVHVYGRLASLGERNTGKSQHGGVGRALVDEAADRARRAGYRTLAVISAVGTRPYYRNLGFQDRGLYQVLALAADEETP